MLVGESNISHIQLSGFISVLKAQGFTITPAHYMDVNSLFNAVDLSESTLQDLADYLCPIFAKGVSDQEQFHQLFRSYFAEFLDSKEFIPTRIIDKDPDEEFEIYLEDQKRQFSETVVFRILIWLSAIVIFIGFGYLIQFFCFPNIFKNQGIFALVELFFFTLVAGAMIVAIFNQIPKGNESLQWLLLSVKSNRLPWIWIGLFILIFAALLFFFPEIWHPKDKEAISFWGIIGTLFTLYLFFEMVKGVILGERKPVEKVKRTPPYVFKPVINLDTIQAMSSQEAHEASLPIVHSLIETEVIDEIDLPGTLDDTIKNAGFLRILNKRRILKANYLMLIDQAGISDHQQGWYNYIYKALRANEFPINRYFYNTDPVHCWQTLGDYKELPDLFDRQRLMIFGSGRSFIDPILAVPYPWVKDAFDAWVKEDLCGLMTPVLPKSWNYKEEALSSLFTVAPATMDGFHEVTQSFDQDSGRDRAFWVEHSNARTYDTENIQILRQQIPLEVYEWVCAVAIYPRMFWDLTLYIGKKLEGHPNELLKKENLDIITRINWFVKGEMNGEVRKELMKYWDEAEGDNKYKELKVRQALIDLFLDPDNQEQLPPRESYAWEEYNLNLLRNEIALEPNTKQKIKKLERLNRMLQESGSEYPELVEFVKAESDFWTRLWWNLQYAILKIMRYTKAGSFERYRYPSGILEQDLQIRMRKTSREPQLGDVIHFHNSGRMRNLSNKINGDQQHAIAHMIHKRIPNINSKKIKPFKADKGVDHKEAIALLKAWAPQHETEFISFLNKDYTFNFTFYDVEIERLKLNKEKSLTLPFDDQKLSVLRGDDSIPRMGLGLDNLLHVSDYINLPSFSWQTIDAVLKCGKVKIERIHKNVNQSNKDEQFNNKSNYIELDLKVKEVSPVIASTTRNIFVESKTVTIGEPAEGNFLFLTDRIKSADIQPPALKDTDRLTFINNENNPGFPALARNEEQIVLIGEKNENAQAMLWWKESLSPTFEVTFEYKINQGQYRQSDVTLANDGLTILLARERLIPENKNSTTTEVITEFVEQRTDYRIQLNTLNSSYFIFDQSDNDHLDGLTGKQLNRATWYSVKIAFGRESVKGWIDGELIINLGHKIPVENFYAGLLVQSEKATGLYRLRNIKVESLEEFPESPQKAKESIDQATNASNERSGQESIAKKPVNFFIFYSRKDEHYFETLKNHLIPLVRNGLVEYGSIQNISPGEEWDLRIKADLEKANAIIYLVSTDFLNSEFYEDMEYVLSRHSMGPVRTIPVNVRQSDIQNSVFRSIQSLPSKAPISEWPNEEEAWQDVIRGLRRVISDIQNDVSETFEFEGSPNLTDEAADFKYSKNLKDNLLQLIQDNQIEAALDLLQKGNGEDLSIDMRNSVFNLSVRWDTLNRRQDQGVISAKEEQVERNTIIDSLLRLVQKL